MLQKKSIREYVQEDELKFYIYLFKYSNQLKNIENLSKEDIEEKHNKAIRARLKRLKSTIVREYSAFLQYIEIKKDEYPSSEIITKKFNNLSSEDKDIYRDSFNSICIINKNEEYIKSWIAPNDPKKIQEEFNEKRDNYIEYLKNTDEKRLRYELDYVKNIELSSDINHEKFGKMIMLMIENIKKMPSFASYTNNWSSDFTSDAVEKILLYIHNYDENILSPRTGEKGNAFAYVTSYCTFAFKNVINLGKKLEHTLKDTISLNNLVTDGIYYESENESTYEEIINVAKIRLNSNDIFNEIVDNINKIKLSNIQFNKNKSIESEIEYITKTTSVKDKSNEYIEYIDELVNNIDYSNCLYEYVVDDIIFIKDANISIKKEVLDYINSTPDFNISLINYKKQKESKIEDEINLEMLDELEEDNFYDEF